MPMSAFNEDQQAYMRELAAMPADAKCACGWYRRGECPNCKPDAGGYERCGNRLNVWTVCGQKAGHDGMHAGWPSNQCSGTASLWSLEDQPR